MNKMRNSVIRELIYSDKTGINQIVVLYIVREIDRNYLSKI